MLAGNVDTAVKKIADLKDQQKVSTLQNTGKRLKELMDCL